MSEQNKFIYQGEEYEYFDHPHHETWTNERRIEVPIAYRYMKKFEGKKILEVGNVMQYYYKQGIIFPEWDVVDKYEHVSDHNLINEDIMTFKPKEQYDMIFSVSTMEHVGFDHENEYKKEHGDYRKGVEATKRLQDECLKDGGSMMVTIPWAYNAAYYLAIFDGELRFKSAVMKRMTSDNRWQQIESLEQVADVRYNYPFYAANAVIFSYYEKT